MITLFSEGLNLLVDIYGIPTKFQGPFQSSGYRRIGEIGQGLEVFLMVSMGGRHANSIN